MISCLCSVHSINGPILPNQLVHVQYTCYSTIVTSYQVCIEGYM